MGADLEARVFQWLDRKAPEGEALALGYSGGGDSQALICLAAQWARRSGVVLHALTVDHGLRAASHLEAEEAARSAERLGAVAHILTWTGDKPETGIQAAARRARHTLLARACRELDVSGLLLAHTLDDQAETVWMRLQAGGGWRSCRGMTERAPSPVWPDGRGVQLLRPLLGERRDTLRTYLTVQDETWLEDPSNEDVQYTRVAIRQHLTRLEAAGFDPTRLAGWADDVQNIDRHERDLAARVADTILYPQAWGGISLNTEALKALVPVMQCRVMEAGLMAVSGRRTPPKRSVLMDLVQAIFEGRSFSGAGARHLIWQGQNWLVRDSGDVLGRVDRPGAKTEALSADKINYWDNRYEIETQIGHLTAGPLGKSYEGLADRRILLSIPGEARSGLLCVRGDEHQVVAVAGLMEHPDVIIRPLMRPRLASRLYPDGVPTWLYGPSESLNTSSLRV